MKRTKTVVSGKCAYSLNHWTALTRFLEDGRLTLDNNLCELQIRSLAIGRKNFLFAGSDAGAEIAGHWVLSARTGDWYGFWVWRMPSRHAILWKSLIPGGLARIAWAAGIPVLIAFVGGALVNPLASRRTVPASPTLVWSTALVTAFIACALAYAKVGAVVNNWILFVAVACIAMGRGLHGLRERRGTRGTRWPVFATGALLVHAGLCAYDPRTKIPTAADLAAGDRIIATLRSIPGDVYVMDDAYMAVRAGKNPYIGGMTLGDLSYAGYPPPSALTERMNRGDFAAVLLRYDATDSKYVQPFSAAIRATYTGAKVQIPYASEETFLPVAGGRYKPRWLLFKPGAMLP